jgi:hypothetical protein
MKMAYTSEKPPEFTFGIYTEKLGDDQLINRLRIKMALIDLFDQLGVSIGHTDAEQEQPHTAALRVQNILAHDLDAANVKYDGKTITVSPDPLADLLHKFPEVKHNWVNLFLDRTESALRGAFFVQRSFVIASRLWRRSDLMPLSSTRARPAANS